MSDVMAYIFKAGDIVSGRVGKLYRVHGRAIEIDDKRNSMLVQWGDGRRAWYSQWVFTNITALYVEERGPDASFRLETFEDGVRRIQALAGLDTEGQQ